MSVTAWRRVKWGLRGAVAAILVVVSIQMLLFDENYDGSPIFLLLWGPIFVSHYADTRMRRAQAARRDESTNVM